MKLEHFCLRGFAQHETIDLQFQDGSPNLIIGPNEAGKSNLMRAITGTLFGIPSPELLTPWNGDAHMIGILTFIADQDRIEVERRFLDQQVVVRVNGDQVYEGRGLVERRTQEDRRYQSMLHDWIGFTEHDVFLRTVFVGQDRVQDQSLGEFTAQIKRLISGTVEANYETAISDLEAELDTLIKLPGKRSDRRQEQLQAQLEDLNQRLYQAESIQEQVVSLTEQERDLQQQLSDANQTRERYSSLVQKHGELQKAIAEENQKRFAWNELEEQITRMTGARDRRAELEQERSKRQIPGDPEPGEITDLARDIERLQMRIEMRSEEAERNRGIRERRKFLESELERLRIPGDVDPSEVRQIGYEAEQSERDVTELQRQLDRAIQREQRTRQPARSNEMIRNALIGAASGMLFVSIGLAVLVNPGFAAGVLVAIALGIAALVMGRRSRAPEVDEISTPEIAQLREDLDQANRVLANYQRKREQLLAESGVETLEDLFYRAREFQENELRLNAMPEVDDQPEADLETARKELKEQEKRRDQLLQETGEADVEALEKRAARLREIDQLLQQVESVDGGQLSERQERLTRIQQDVALARQERQHLLEEHPELRQVSAEQIAEYRSAVETAEHTRESAERRLYEVELERQHLRRDTEDAGELRIRIAEVRDQLEQVRLNADAHALAIDALHSSVREFQENALDPVADRAGSYLAGMTDRRYERVHLERDTMTPTVSGTGQSTISLDQLSRGARDQLYLSIRAALVDALSGDRNLPLLLDDPCVNFDDERLAGAARLIADLARDRQVLLFTKDETWTRWFSPVLRLER